MNAMTRTKGDDPSQFASFYEDAYGHFDMERRVAGTVPLTLIDVQQDSHATTDRTEDDYAFALILESDVRNVVVDGGDGKAVWSARMGTVGPQLPGTEVTFDVEGPHSVLLLSAPRAAVEEVLASAGIHEAEPLRHLHATELYDPLIERTMRAIWEEAAHGDAASTLAVDGLFSGLLARMLRIDRPERRARTLSMETVAAIAAHVRARLDQKIAVADLAAVAGISPFHFARAFKAATGETSHAFVTQLRIARAREMLAGRVPIAEIALDCGFSSQSHFTDSFRRHTSVTPGTFRKEARG